MFITASKIINLPVASLESNQKVGEVNQIIFDPESLTLIALEVKIGGFLSKSIRYLSGADIIDIDNNGVVLRDNEALVLPSEIVRLKNIIKDRTTIYHQKAITKSGKRLGKIFDLLIDTQTLSIIKFYISNLLEERILPADKVLRVTRKAVIFSDEVIEQIPLAEAEGAAA